MPAIVSIHPSITLRLLCHITESVFDLQTLFVTFCVNLSLVYHPIFPDRQIIAERHGYELCDELILAGILQLKKLQKKKPEKKKNSGFDGA